MPNLVPISDGADNLGTAIKRWGGLAITGDITDGTHSTNAEEISDAYLHSETTGNPHSTTAADVSADAIGTAAAAVASHEGLYDHELIIDADPTGTAAGLMSTHNSTYDHTKIQNANKLQGFDVATTTPASGQVLAWSETNSQWQPGYGDMLDQVYTDTTLNGSGTGTDQLSVADNGHDHLAENITDLGSAAEHDVPSTGNADADEVVLGSDTRLSNTRTPSAHASTHESGGADYISHDDLFGFVANEHVNHSSINLTAANGVTGGGTITGSVSVGLGASGVTVGAYKKPTVYYDVFGRATTATNGNEYIQKTAVHGAITAGTGVFTFRSPCAMTITAVRISVGTAPTASSSSSSSSSSSTEPNILTVDINVDGTSILSTKLTIDNGEKTSKTATTQAVISDNTLVDDEEISVDVDQISDGGTEEDLVLTIIGTLV